MPLSHTPKRLTLRSRLIESCKLTRWIFSPEGCAHNWAGKCDGYILANTLARSNFVRNSRLFNLFPRFIYVDYFAHRNHYLGPTHHLSAWQNSVPHRQLTRYWHYAAYWLCLNVLSSQASTINKCTNRVSTLSCEHTSNQTGPAFLLAFPWHSTDSSWGPAVSRRVRVCISLQYFLFLPHTLIRSLLSRTLSSTPSLSLSLSLSLFFTRKDLVRGLWGVTCLLNIFAH